jgi:hypothetical protein
MVSKTGFDFVLHPVSGLEISSGRKQVRLGQSLRFRPTPSAHPVRGVIQWMARWPERRQHIRNANVSIRERETCEVF